MEIYISNSSNRKSCILSKYAVGRSSRKSRSFCKTSQQKAQHYDKPHSLLQYNRQSPSKQVYNTTCISCPWIRLNCTIKLVQIVISLRSFLGFYNYYRKFIANWLSKIEPFTKITRKDENWK